VFPSSFIGPLAFPSHGSAAPALPDDTEVSVEERVEERPDSPLRRL
jgi:hypothetical protein